MLKHLQSRRGDRTVWERGFTLVELLVVIVILGILAAVVVFAVGGTEKDAKVKACRSERSAVEAYKAAGSSPGGVVPTPSVADLVSNADPNINDGKPLLKHDPHYWQGPGDNLQRKNLQDVPAAKCDANT